MADYGPLIEYLQSEGRHTGKFETDAIQGVWKRAIKAADEKYKNKAICPKYQSIYALLKGDIDAQEFLIPLARLEIGFIASRLFGHNPRLVTANGLELMLNARTQPIRSDIETKSDARTLENILYLKTFDPQRAFGLELYGLLAGIGADYRFITDGTVIVEEKVEGKHLFDMKPKEKACLKDNRVYISQRIAMDTLGFSLGFGDIIKLDNFVVSAEGLTRVIDFDYRNLNLPESEIERLKNKTADELGISREEYNSIFEKQLDLVRFNYGKQKSKVDALINAFGKLPMYSTDADAIMKALNREGNVRAVEAIA